MASTLDTHRATIEARIKSNWTETDIAWPNEQYTPDSDPYIQPTILWGGSGVTTKNGRNTVTGILHINIFVSRETGTGALYGYADTIRDLFNRDEVSSVRFETPSGPTFVDAPDRAWLQAAVVCPFTVEETA